MPDVLFVDVTLVHVNCFMLAYIYTQDCNFTVENVLLCQKNPWKAWKEELEC